MDNRYVSVATPPPEILKVIEAGKLKGRFDINPQWKIEAMTNTYGLCGEGWKYQVVHTETVNCPGGEVLLFMMVQVSIKCGNSWSEPVTGYGGDYIVQSNKNGLVPNDEAYKMALTDALGNALKVLGVAAEVYKGNMDKMDSKYSKRANSCVPAQQNNSVYTCDICGKTISDKVQAFSMRKYGKSLCMECQNMPNNVEVRN